METKTGMTNTEVISFFISVLLACISVLLIVSYFDIAPSTGELPGAEIVVYIVPFLFVYQIILYRVVAKIKGKNRR